MAKTKEKQSWKPFLKLLHIARIPWIGFAIYVAVTFGISTIRAKLPSVAGKIAKGAFMEDPDMIVTYVWVTILTTLLSIGSNLFINWVARVCDKNLRGVSLHKLIHLPLRNYQKEKPSTFVSRVTEDTSAISLALIDLVAAISSVYSVILMLGYCYAASPKVTYILLIAIPWILFVCLVSGRIVYHANKQRQEAYAGLTGYVANRLMNIRLIKSFHAEQAEIKNGQEQADQLYRKDKKVALTGLISRPLAYSVDTVCNGAVMLFGAYLVNTGELEFDSLVMILMYMQTIPTLLMQPITCYRSIKQGQGMSAKISSLVEESEEKLKSKRSFALENSDIVLDHVNFSYGRKANLRDVSMTLPYGKMTAIVGPSGAGKSTLLNILERFYIPNSGEIRFGNVPVEDIHLDEWREAWGYVQQSSVMIRGTIRDNICFGTKRNVTDTEIRAVCEEANILKLVDSLPKGLDTDIGEIGNKLSGGERQRVAIARMLIRNPDFVILDEATNNLDAENAREVQKTLEKVIRGRTSVVVTHDMQSIRHADQIVVLCKGCVTAIGTHEQLYGKDKTYTEFCQLQQKIDS